jgi:outer membrane protein OmpU
MKHTRIKSVLLPLALALPVFAAQAADDVNEAELQRQFNEIKTRLAQLEQNKVVASEEQESNTDMHFYGTLRPTFGVTSTDERDDWDVGDALSRIGFAAEHKLSNGMVGFAKGEFKVQI